VRTGAARELFPGVMEKGEREIEQTAGNALAVDGDVLFIQMPAARADLQHGDLVVQFVYFSGLVREADRAADRVLEVHLALDLVEPVRTVRVLEIGHVRIRAGI